MYDYDETKHNRPANDANNANNAIDEDLWAPYEDEAEDIEDFI